MGTRLALAAALLPALLVLPRPGLAVPPGAWTETGPGGGRVYSLAVEPWDGDTVYAAAGRAGVYKTRDGGASWFWSGNRLTGENIQLVTLDPARPNLIYAATADSAEVHRAAEQVYRSPDRGLHWEPIFTATLEPTDRLDVAAAQGVVYVMTPRDLFRSADGGKTWSQVFAAGVLLDVQVDPGNPDIVYLASPVGVLKTTDGGASWAQVGPFSSPGAPEGIAALALSLARPATLYASDAVPRLYRSDDGGATWSAALPLPDSSFAIAADPEDPSTVYQLGTGVFVSHDGGATFAPIRRGLPLDSSGGPRPVLDLAVRRDRPGALYAATLFDGVYVSHNARRWQPATDGLAARQLAWIKPSPQVPSTLYLSDTFNLYRSGDGGASWSPFAPSLTGTTIVRDLLLDPRDPALLFAGTVDGAYRSADGGATWTHLGLYKDLFGGLVEVDRQTLVAASTFGVFRTTDGGRTWREVLNRSLGLPPHLDGRTVQWLKNDPAAPGTIYGYLLESYDDRPGAKGYLFRSLNGGATWEALKEDLYFTQIVPGHPGRLYATRLHQVLRSDDGGRRWRVVADVPGVFFADLAIDPFHPGTIYAGTFGQSVYQSRDGGVTWDPASIGLAHRSRLFVIRVVAHPSMPDRIYALPNEGGLFQADF
ncbi:MAG TPA: YCF48-related protein [Thermoanaerobaculia bacterium]|nr:YCF48-related protein [Thermoanaerobaculia bacterium]